MKCFWVFLQRIPILPSSVSYNFLKKKSFQAEIDLIDQIIKYKNMIKLIEYCSPHHAAAI